MKTINFYNITLDQLVRDDFDLPMSINIEADNKGDKNGSKFALDEYLGKICDISMNSFRYSVIRNVQIVGMYENMVCFLKGKRYGYFNKDKSLGILVKSENNYKENNTILHGRCTVYVNKGTYFGGNTYAFSSIENVSQSGIEVHTGKFVANVSFEDLSVIMMSDKIKD